MNLRQARAYRVDDPLSEAWETSAAGSPAGSDLQIGQCRAPLPTLSIFSIYHLRLSSVLR
jgi:hypothetical protein